jgi:mono/diheme cytochrome c family protein
MFKKTLKMAALTGAGAVTLALAGVGYLYVRKPQIEQPPEIAVAATPERLARGKYLYEVVADCDGCHSERDFSRFGGPVVPSGRGKGGVFPPELGLPGKISAPNITPDKETGIGNWSDGEKIRAIRDGIGRDCRALFPMMPYRFLRRMSDHDVESLVAYLNSLRPVRNVVPRSEVDFPASILMKEEPRPAGRVSHPGRGDKAQYGEYLAALGSCMDCHTKEEKGKPVPGMLLAGGREFHFPGAVVVSANITPDRRTGIGRWTEQDFLERFYQYRDYADHGSPAVGPDSFTLMPWLSLSRMDPEDLKAIYAFLRTQRPVYNPVETHPLHLPGKPAS